MSVLDELYKEIILAHYKSPRNHGELEGATLEVRGHNPACGDQISLAFVSDGTTVQDVRFQGQGCAISQASASLLTEAVKGKTWDEALDLFAKFKAMVVDGAPPAPELGELSALSGVHRLHARVKCATLAWNALEEAAKLARADG